MYILSVALYLHHSILEDNVWLRFEYIKIGTKKMFYKRTGQGISDYLRCRKNFGFMTRCI